MLDECVSPAVEEMRSIRLIGGPLAEPVFLGTYILSAKGSLCVSTNTFGRISEHCLPVESSVANAMVIQLWEDPVSVEKPGNVTPRAATPLFDKFFENLELAAENTQGGELMELIEANCFFGDLCSRNSTGDAVQTPIPLPLKMETLLEAAKEQRQLHLKSLPRSRKEKVVDATYQISEDDMKAIYNR